MNARRTIGALALVAAPALTGCGRDEGGGDGAGQQSAAIAEGAATGEITVWAMGTEASCCPSWPPSSRRRTPTPPSR
jgi:multiple sugar transport system substrate-binding protein